MAANFRKRLVLQKGQASGFAEKSRKLEIEAVCIDNLSISANSQNFRAVIPNYQVSENIVTFRTVPAILDCSPLSLTATSQQEIE